VLCSQDENVSDVAEQRAPKLVDDKVNSSVTGSSHDEVEHHSRELPQSEQVEREDQKQELQQKDSSAEVIEQQKRQLADENESAADKIRAGFHGMKIRQTPSQTVSLPHKDLQHGPVTDDDVSKGKEDFEERAVSGEEHEGQTEDVEQKTRKEEVELKDESKLEVLKTTDRQEDEDAPSGGNVAKQQPTCDEVQDSQSKDVEKETEKEQIRPGEGLEDEEKNKDLEVESQQKDEDVQTQMDESEGGESESAAAAIGEKEKDEVYDAGATDSSEHCPAGVNLGGGEAVQD